MTHAFTRDPPLADPDAIVVKLRILRIDAATLTAQALIIGPFTEAPHIKRAVVKTVLGSCSGWGLAQGEVYAVVAFPRIEGDTLYFDAIQQRQPTPSRAERERYRISAHHRGRRE